MTAPLYTLEEAAANPLQPPEAVQALNHPGARMQAESVKALLAQPLALQASYGDVYFDWSTAAVTASQLKGAGASGAFGYLSPWDPTTGAYYGPTAVKMMTVPKLDWLVNTLGLVEEHNYEWYPERMAEGAAAADQDAYWAGTLAYHLDTAIGRPTRDRRIFFSDDKDGTPYNVAKTYLLVAQARLNLLPGGYLADYYGRQGIIAQLVNDPDLAVTA